MSEERAVEAILRIDSALARIEAAAGRAPAAANAPDLEPELRRLRQVHEALRGRVEGAIGQIDRLLDAAPGGEGQG
jgi:hypothetical protein